MKTAKAIVAGLALVACGFKLALVLVNIHNHSHPTPALGQEVLTHLMYSNGEGVQSAEACNQGEAAAAYLRLTQKTIGLIDKNIASATSDDAKARLSALRTTLTAAFESGKTAVRTHPGVVNPDSCALGALDWPAERDDLKVVEASLDTALAQH